jgi:predicted RNA binding protein YcfA (HicA-like mRNA interferase family)
MSPRLPAVTGKELLRALEKLGFEQVRTRGSHHFLRHPDGRMTVVPVHGNESIGPGLLVKILHDCRIRRDDLSAVL